MAPFQLHGLRAKFLREETLLYPEYIDEMEKSGCLPGKVETNYDVWESQPWFEEWVESIPPQKRDDPFQGAKERRCVPMDPISLKKSIHPHPMLSSDAETIAGAMAIVNSGIDKNEIDLVLCSTLILDKAVPFNASLVQHKLGLKNAGAYNIDTCCSSFITMLEVAMTYVRSGMKKNVLIVTSALHSIVRDPSSYFSVYVGDGAAAAIVSEVDDSYDYIASYCTSHGSRHDGIILHRRGPVLLTPNTQGPKYEQEFVTFYNQQACKEIAHNASVDLKEVVFTTLEKSGNKPDDIDFLITHQPVPWTAPAWREAIGLAESKSYESFEKYGNIACASVPVNLVEAVELGLINSGDKVMLASSGAGENHISLFQRISPKLISSNRL